MNNYYDTYGNANRNSTNNEANGILPTLSSSTDSLQASDDHVDRVIAVSKAAATTSSGASYTRSTPRESSNNEANGILPTLSSSTDSLQASDDHGDRVIAVSRAAATTTSDASFTRSAPLSNAALDMQQQQQHERNSLAASEFGRNRTALAYLGNPTVSLSTNLRNESHRQNQQHLNTRQAGRPSFPLSNNTNPTLADQNGNSPKPKPIQSPERVSQTLSLQTRKPDFGETVPEAENQQQQNKYQKQQRGTRNLTMPTGSPLSNHRVESKVSPKRSCHENASSAVQGPISSKTLSSPLYSSEEPKPPDPENVAPLNNSEMNGGYREQTQEPSERTQDHEEELGSNDMSASDSIEAIQPGTDFPNQPDNDTNRK